MATGDTIIPESLGLWRRTVITQIKGVVLAGRFDPNLIEMGLLGRVLALARCGP